MWGSQTACEVNLGDGVMKASETGDGCEAIERHSVLTPVTLAPAANGSGGQQANHQLQSP